MPSPRTRLTEALARHVHVSDMAPAVAFLWWSDYERKQLAIAAECGRVPSEWDHLADDAEREAAYAHARRARYVQPRWDLSRLRAAQAAHGHGFDLTLPVESPKQPKPQGRIDERMNGEVAA